MNPPVGRDLLNALKASTGDRDPVLSLPVGSPVEAILRPVATREGGLRADDVWALTTWRNRHAEAFATEFEANEDRTRRWLTEMVGPDDTRVMFMVNLTDGRTIGYMGLAFIDWKEGYGEADAIVRGGDAAPGVMRKALEALLGWARVQLGLCRLGVRVRSDNAALEFYRKLGFRESRRVPLRRVEEVDMIRWVEDPSLAPSEPSLVHMELTGVEEDATLTQRVRG